MWLLRALQHTGSRGAIYTHLLLVSNLPMVQSIGKKYIVFASHRIPNEW